MENTPEYQEYHHLLITTESLTSSLKQAVEVNLPELKKKLDEACAANGHDYGQEVETKHWCKRMVSYVHDSSELSYEERERDEGHYEHYMAKTCIWCAHVSERSAIVTTTYT